MVEMALVLPLLLILLLGIVDFGKAFNYWNDSTHLAATGARFAVVNSNPGTGLTLQQYIQQQADSNELRNGSADGSVQQPLKVCIDFPAGSAQVGDPVQVSVSADYNWLNYLTASLGLDPAEIKGTATMRLEQVPSAYTAGCTS